MRFLKLNRAILAVLALAATALAHEDVTPYSYNGKVTTGGHDDGEETHNVFQRVFGYDFGEVPEDPYFIGDPGFNNGAFAIGVFPNDGLLPSGFTLGFNLLTHLNYWDGDLPVAFAPAPVGVELGLNRGSFTVNVSGTGQTGTVPTIGSTGGIGRLHVHLGSLLNTTDGIDPLPPNAPNGVYLVGMELKLLGSGLANSDPIYFVYNNGLDEATHDLAMEWAETNLVPEPSSWTLMAMAAGAVAFAAGLRRKRRQVIH